MVHEPPNSPAVARKISNLAERIIDRVGGTTVLG
jgi:hypothetical protein